ncbi:uncharacterized protein A4U43_UnF9820 [Asparagus officinalis]|uniref:Uncharacterized protein n=1 Tax=Asparagus officinalis TaxID=4686 RepID=A0A1R3L5L5_ASPOF|nr:uncharacterized protein A4U43_UnF9820 [Asparagus officinalis]
MLRRNWPGKRVPRRCRQLRSSGVEELGGDGAGEAVVVEVEAAEEKEGAELGGDVAGERVLQERQQVQVPPRPQRGQAHRRHGLAAVDAVRFPYPLGQLADVPFVAHEPELSIDIQIIRRFENALCQWFDNIFR